MPRQSITVRVKSELEVEDGEFVIEATTLIGYELALVLSVEYIVNYIVEESKLINEGRDDPF